MKFVTSSKYKLFKYERFVYQRCLSYLTQIKIPNVVRYYECLHSVSLADLFFILETHSLCVINYYLGQEDNVIRFFTSLKYASNQSYNVYLTMMYICIGIVLVTIFLIFIQIIAKESSIALEIIRFSSTLLTGIAFEPIYRLLLGYMACYSNSMVYVQGQTCWNGEYILHAAISIVTMIAYLIYIVVFSQICIESKQADYNVMAQRQGQTSLYYYSFILASLIAYSVLEKPKFTFIVILIQFGLSLTFYYQIQKDAPYYNQIIQRIWLIISGVNLWTQLMMLYSFLLENKFVTKTLDVWFIGIPLIIAIILSKQSEELNLLQANISSDQMEKTCEYIFTLFQSKNNRKAQLLLEGYIQVHKQICINLDCVLKKNKKLQKKNHSIPSQEQQIIELVNELYQQGISLHPTCVDLKIHYAYFLLDKMKRKQQALNELYQAEACDPSFDQQFFIFRYQQIIEEQIQKQQQQRKNEKLDLITQKLMRQEQKTFVQAIEDSAIELSEFWSHFLDIPNLQIVQNKGHKILQSIEKIEKQYQKIMEFDNSSVRINKIICKYYQLILHDDQLAIKFSQLAKKQDLLNQKQKTVYDEIEHQEDPLITLSLQKGEKSVILNINQAACSLLGYTKTDLLHKQLAFILPNSYEEYNQKLVDYFFEQQEMETNQINQFTERLLMLKSKTSYLIPCYSLSQVMNTTTGFIMISKLRQDTYFKPRCYLLLDHQGKIDNASAQCLQMLNWVSIHNVNISSVFPEIQIPIQMNKSLFITQKCDTSNNQYNIHNFLFSTILIETPYYTQQDYRYQVFGYIVKVDSLVDGMNQHSLLVKKRSLNYGFKFYPLSHSYKLEPIETTVSNVESNREESIILDEEPQQLFLQKKQSGFTSKKKISSKRIIYSEKQYGNDIRTVRLFKNKIIEVDEESMEEDEVSVKLEVDEKQFHQQEQHLLISSRSELIQQLKESILPLIMLKILIIINFFIITTIVITFIKFESLFSDLDNIRTSLNVLLKNNLRYSNILKIQSNLQDLRFVYYNVLPYTQATVNGEFEFVNRMELGNEIDALIQNQNYLLSMDLQMNSGYESYYNQFNRQMIAMVQVNGDVQYYLFNDVIQQLLSRAVTLNNSDLSSFSDLNQNYFYFNYNVMNSVAIFSDVALNYYYYKIFNSTQQLYQAQLYFSIAQLCLIGLIYLTIHQFERKHEVIIQEMLQLFLHLDTKFLKKLIKQTQDYLNALRNENEMDSINDENQEYEDNDQQSKSKLKKFTYKQANKNTLYLTPILGIIVFFFIYNLISTNIIINDTNAVAPLLNITSFAAGYYRVLDNALREAIWNPQIQLFENEALLTVNSLIDQIYELDATIHILNQQNENSLDSEYNQAFDNIYILDPCPYLTYPWDNGIQICQSFYDSILQEGLSIGITKFLENERYILESLTNYNASKQYDLDYNLSQNDYENYRFNLLNTGNANDNRVMTKVFIDLCQVYLSDKLQNSLNNHYDSLTLQIIITLISFILFVIFIYLILWIPHLRSNIQNIYKNRRMIAFIPLNKIKEIPEIKEYIKIWIKKDVI